MVVTSKKLSSLTLIASAAVGRYRFINTSGATATAGDDVIGVSEASASADLAVSVVTGFSALVEAAGPIAVNDIVGPAGDGTGRATADGGYSGRALTPATAAGQLVEVALFGGAGLSAASAMHQAAAETYGAHYNASAAFNVAAINLALSRHSAVTLTRPGQYLIGGPGQGGLILPSNTALVCAAGVELILADQTFAPLIRGANAFASGITLSTAVTWVLGGPSFQARIDHPGIHLLYPVGSWFGLLNLPGSNANNRGYQGVWKVTQVATNQIFFHLAQQPPSGGNSATGGVVFPADVGQRIIGGMWDGNETGQTGSGYNDGDPRGLIHFFRNAQNLIVSGPSYRKGEAWCYGSNNCRDVTIRDIDADTYSGIGVVQAHDIVHLAGGHRNVLIERITAECDDNIVGMTLDDIDGPATYPHYFPGDTHDITIRDIAGRDTSAAIVALWGNVNYMHHSTTIDRVTGKGAGAAVQVSAPYAPTDMLNCNGGVLKIRDITGSFNSAPVLIQSEGNWDHILIDTIRNESLGSVNALVNVTRSATTQSIKKLEIKNVAAFVQGVNQNRSGPAIVVNNSNIDDLNIEGLNGMRLAANVSLVAFTGTLGTVLRATVEKANATSNAAGDSFIVSCENTGAAALGRLTVRDSHMEGISSTGGVVRQTPTGKVTLVRIDNSTQNAGEGVTVMEGTGATVQTVTAA